MTQDSEATPVQRPATVTLPYLKRCAQQQQRFTCLTAYDATFAALLSQAGIDVLLVGDSLGMVCQGHSSTLPVTLDDMLYHTAAVCRGNQGGALIISDMPFASCITPEHTVQQAAQLMRAGANMVKLEGGRWLVPAVERLVQQGIPCCAHLGLTPQFINQLGHYRVQGKTPSDADRLIDDARQLQQAGVDMLLLECVPAALAQHITQNSQVPVIGIGAGAATHAQVLVCYDMLGLTPGPRAKFVRNFMQGASSYQQAIEAYIQAVKSGSYPDATQQY